KQLTAPGLALPFKELRPGRSRLLQPCHRVALPIRSDTGRHRLDRAPDQCVAHDAEHLATGFVDLGEPAGLDVADKNTVTDRVEDIPEPSGIPPRLFPGSIAHCGYSPLAMRAGRKTCAGSST